MGAHLGLESKEYACHFAQLAYLLGSSELQLRASGEWLEWSCDGNPLDEATMQATAAGQFQMADLHLCLNFCLQCLVLTPYVEKIFSSGGFQLRYLAPHWQLRATKVPGTRLQLRLPLQNRVRNFFRSGWWQKLPELKQLEPRLRASHLQFKTPAKLDLPTARMVLGVFGRSPISSKPPVPARCVVRYEDRALSGSCWLDFEGNECHVLSQGLSYATYPFLPGRIWLSMGDLPLDLGRRDLVLNPNFYAARLAFVNELSHHFSGWITNRELQEAGVQDWLLRCLVQFSGGSISVQKVTLLGSCVQKAPQGEDFFKTLAVLPLIPTLGRPRISLAQLDEEVAVSGCYLLEEAVLRPPKEAPLMVISREPSFTAFLRIRYSGAIHSGAELLARISDHQKRMGEQLDLQELSRYPYSAPIELEGWRGGMAFDPKQTKARLQCYRNGKLLFELNPTKGLVAGFWLKVDHPELKPDADWRAPLANEAWKDFLSWAQLGQATYLSLIMQQLQQHERRDLMWRVLETSGIRMGPLLQVPLWDNLTLETWLLDGQKGDLRRWVEAGVEISEPLVFMLTEKFGWTCAQEALQRAANYKIKLALWRDRPQMELELPAGTLAQASTNFPLRIGLVESPGTHLRLYCQGRFLVLHLAAGIEGLSRGLVVAAEHREFRLDARGTGLDPYCRGYQQLLQAIKPAVTALLEQMLQHPPLRQLALETLESLSAKHWPSQSKLFSRLDGQPVSLAAAQTRAQVRVLVAPAAQVVLPGFEECWCLGNKELSWAVRVLRLNCLDVTKDYNEAYRVHRYEKGISGQAEEIPDWSQPQPFECGGLRARAGLVREPGPAQAVQASFCRGGKTVMRCLLLIGRDSGRILQEKLVCRVDWEELPFAQSYGQLRALPEVGALVDWLRLYSFRPLLENLPYQLERLLLEAAQEPLFGWGQSKDPILRELLSCPFLPNPSGSARSLQDLLASDVEVVHAVEPSLLRQLQQLLPDCRWRHFSEPAPDEGLKRSLLRQTPRELQMPELPMLLEGRSPQWVWRLLASQKGASQLNVLYQGRLAGSVAPNWDFKVTGEILVDEVHLTPAAEIRLIGELRTKLFGLRQEIQQRILTDLKGTDRLRLILSWLNCGQVPTWASGLEDLMPLQRWWSDWDSPRPFFQGEGWRGEIPCGGPELADWAGLEGIGLYDCTDFAERSARTRVFQRPESEFEVEGWGFYLSAHRSIQQTVEREVYRGGLLDEQVRTDFPPYYLERKRSDWRECDPVPSYAFESLRAWWSKQLEEPLERLGWVQAMESLLEKAAPEGCSLIQLARLQLLRLQQKDRDDGWGMLRRGLELLCVKSVFLETVQQGPLLECDGFRLQLNERLAGQPTRPRTAELLCLASLELDTRRTVIQVLTILQDEQARAT